jgi:SAM-dependent methyltransferase
MTDHHHGHGHAHSPDHRDWASHGQRLVDEGELRMPILLEALDAIAAHVGPRDTVGRILDIGSGPGVAAVALAQRFSEAQVTAVDLAEPLADQARARAAAFGVGDGVDATIADLEQSLTHLADAGSVDVVWASMVLHHLEALPAALREIAQLLRPDGLLAIVEFGTTPGPLPAPASAPTDSSNATQTLFVPASPTTCRRVPPCSTGLRSLPRRTSTSSNTGNSHSTCRPRSITPAAGPSTRCWK